MRVLVVKTSSLGDVLHALPAATDAMQAVPGLRLHWVVEEAFAEVPVWHPAVEQVVAVALRRWRRSPLEALRSGEWRAFRARLRRVSYDRIIDAQGLCKSAAIACLARGQRCGLDWDSAREPIASWAYQRPVHVPRGLHAVERVRLLFAAALGYPPSSSEPDFRLEGAPLPRRAAATPYLVFLHGTTWATKQWPEGYWRELAAQASARGFAVLVPWWGPEEWRRAELIASAAERAEVLAPRPLSELAALLRDARGVVGVDTGLTHLAAALQAPLVTLYGATRPGLTGTVGPRQVSLASDFHCAPCLDRRCRFEREGPLWPPCYGALTPERVLAELERKMQGVEAVREGRSDQAGGSR